MLQNLTWITFVEGSLLSSSLVTNGLCLFYISFHLDINSYVLDLLKLDAGFKFASMTISNIGYFLIGKVNIDLLVPCSLYILSGAATVMSSYFFQPAIAVIRY